MKRPYGGSLGMAKKVGVENWGLLGEGDMPKGLLAKCDCAMSYTRERSDALCAESKEESLFKRTISRKQVANGGRKQGVVNHNNHREAFHAGR